MVVVTPWRTRATIPGRYRLGLATRTSSTRSDTPKWRPTGSRTFGGMDRGRWLALRPESLGPSLAPRSERSTAKIVPFPRRRHIFRSRAGWRSDLAWHALSRANRSVGLQHHSILGFGR